MFALLYLARNGQNLFMMTRKQKTADNTGSTATLNEKGNLKLNNVQVILEAKRFAG